MPLSQLKFQYERKLNDRFTIGLIQKTLFSDFSGMRFEPTLRYYFKKEAPKGFYVQAKVGVGYHYYYNFIRNSDSTTTQTNRQYFWAYGGGLAGGYQFIIGSKKHFVIDLYLGLQVFQAVLPHSPIKDKEGMDKKEEYEFWEAFPLDFGLSIGYNWGRNKKEASQ